MIKLTARAQSSFHMTPYTHHCKNQVSSFGCRRAREVSVHATYSFYKGKIPKLEAPWSHSDLGTVSSLRPGILSSEIILTLSPHPSHLPTTAKSLLPYSQVPGVRTQPSNGPLFNLPHTAYCKLEYTSFGFACTVSPSLSSSSYSSG